MRGFGLALACFVFAASGAHSATVTPQRGTVFVNPGGGYAQIQAPTEVPAASKVMISPGGSATLTYSPDCSIQIAEGVWSVSEQAPCGGADYGWRTTEVVEPAETSGIGPTTLVVGGLVVAGGAAAAIALSGGGDDKPASP